ncbi:MAG: EAL domain-containing protein [Dehalococcoidia bacterium]
MTPAAPQPERASPDLGDRLERVHTLTHLSRMISASLDMETVLTEIARAAGQIMHAPVVSFWLADEATGVLERRAVVDTVSGPDFPIKRVVAGDLMVGWVAARREAVNVPDIFTDDRFTAHEWWRARGLCSSLAVPVTLDDRLQAVLFLAGHGPFHYGADERGLLDGLVAQAALAIRNAALYTELAATNARLEADIAERRRVEEALRRSEARFRSLVQHGSDIIMVLTAEGAVRYASPAIGRVLGYGAVRTDGPALNLRALVHPDDAAGLDDHLAAVLQSREGHDRCEARVRHADGGWRHLELVCANHLDDPAVGGIVCNARDVTEHRAAQRTLTFHAFHDSLTGLPNRALFLDQTNHALARTADGVAVLFVDVDRFTIINDSLGHRTGDELLVAVARRIAGCIGPSATVARIGGDEFTILVESGRQPADAMAVAESVVHALRVPFALHGRDVYLSASIGIAVSDGAATRATDLLRHADVALQRAKARVRGGAVLFERGMHRHAMDLLDLDTDLRRAIDRNELRLFYQPEIDVATGAIVGVEALARWQHPRRGLVPPAEFIPLAEETGLILAIGPWVLEHACRRARAWQTERGGRPLVMSVNLSAREFQHAALVSNVARALERSGLNPALLRLEVTESVAMYDADAALGTLLALKALGVQLAIDDFGAGYSSLSYLRRFPFDTVKIDRSFASDLLTDDGDAIVRAATALAHALRMDVTLEGVETAEQLARAATLGCDRAQGYYISKPQPAKALAPLLERGRL